MEGIKMRKKHSLTYLKGLFWVVRCCFLAVLLLVSLEGQSQSASASTVLSPEQSLRSTNLSSLQFNAYSDRALEKVNEWLTYMSLLQESRQDSLLYRELSGYASELFLQSDIALIYGNSKLALADWLQANQSYDGNQVVISRHEWIDDWAMSNGQFNRNLMIHLMVMEGDSPAWSGERVMTIYLTRIKKDFGGEKIETWEIRLGAME